MIPFVDLKQQYQALKPEIEAAFNDVLEHTAFVKGPQVKAFQEEFAAFCRTRHALGTSSGTTAIHLPLAALGIGPGHEVIVPANTFIATAEPVVQAGAVPVFADVDPDTQLMDPESVRRAVTDKTKAVIPVHLYGQMAPMKPLLELGREIGAHVIEDAAQAHGAQQDGVPAGGLGVVGCFSFYPGKNLGAYGDAGAVVTQDESLAAKMTKLCDHGRETKYTHDLVGFNYRMDGLQGAVLRVKLRHLADWNVRRRSRAELYTKLLSDVPGVKTPVTAPGNVHVFHLYVIECDDRDGLRAFLADRNIASGIHYPVPLHQQPALKSYARGPLPHAEASAKRILSLPIFPELTDEQVAEVVQAVKAFVTR